MGYIRYSSISTSMGKTYSAAPQLVTENQQPFQSLASYSWNTTDIQRNTQLDFPPPIGVVITPTEGLANNVYVSFCFLSFV
jgi:hypothetical protein